MGKFIDLTGQTINGIYIDTRSEKSVDGHVEWNCKCHCGNWFVTSSQNILTGRTKSCGCSRYNWAEKKRHDFSGEIYNNILVESFAGIKSQKTMWNCKCLLCGKHFVACGANIKNGHTTSCGCRSSKAEENIKRFLDDNNIQYETQKTFIQCANKKKLRFDFYLVDYGLAIEYDGEFHFSKREGMNNDLAYQQSNDVIKNTYCEENDIILLRIPYWEKDNIESILTDWLFLNDDEEADSSDVSLSA